MGLRADSIRVVHPLFQAEGGGSIPTSALQLFVDRIRFEQARDLNAVWHSRLPRIGDPARLMRAGLCYAATFEDVAYAVAIWSHPVNRSLPQNVWIELRRLAVAPDAPKNTASRFLAVMARLIRRERPGLRRLISYQDTDVHTGTIYRAAGWTPTVLSSWNTWNKPNSRNQNGRPRTRPKDQSQADKQRWEKVMHANIQWTELTPPEKRRTYHFAGGDTVSFENVARVEIRDSGKHRVETADGRKAFVAPGWLWLEIDVADWTC